MWSRKFYHIFGKHSTAVFAGFYGVTGEYATFGAVEPIWCSSTQIKRPTNWATPGYLFMKSYWFVHSRRPSCCGTRNFLLANAHKISTAATHSPRCICHRQRSARSPTGPHPDEPGVLYRICLENATDFWDSFHYLMNCWKDDRDS